MNTNFLISYSLESGKKYYFCAEMYNSSLSGQFDVILKIDNKLYATYKDYNPQKSLYLKQDTCCLSSSYDEQKKLEVVATANETDGITYEWYKSDYYYNLMGYLCFDIDFDSLTGFKSNYTKINKYSK